MSEVEYESDFSSSETVYTHFRSINNSDQIELSATADNHSHELEKSDKHVKLKSFSLKLCEVLLLLTLIIIVWFALSIPSIFFFISKIGENSTDSTSSTPDLGNCTSFKYAGSVCTDYLRSYQGCSTGAAHISDAVEHVWTQNEDRLATIFGFAEQLASRNCILALRPLACLYYFPLCDKTTGKAVYPSARQCHNLENIMCKREFEQLKAFNFDLEEYIPNCDTLPEEGPDPITKCPNTSIVPPTLHCSDDFKYDNTTEQCRPNCGTWSPYSDVELRASEVVVILSGAVAILSGVIVLVLSCVRCKKVFSYPSIFIVYQTIPTIFLGSLVLIAYVDTSRLFCSSPFALESFRNPTAFCTLTGVSLYYITMQLIILWLFHVISIFWGVYWPLQASMTQMSPKRIVPHLIAVDIALIVPAIPVCLIHFLGGGFTITRFPPILCAAKSLNFNYYTFILPISVIIACGLTFLVLIFWKLLKKRIRHHIHQTRTDTHWCAHARVLTVLSYFVVFGIIVLSAFTVSAINFQRFRSVILDYFDCEKNGLGATLSDTSSMCREEREAIVRLVNPIITIIALVILGFFPAVNLVYVFHTKEIKKNCMCCGVTREVEYTNRPFSVYQSGISSTTSSVRGVRLDTHGLI